MLKTLLKLYYKAVTKSQWKSMNFFLLYVLLHSNLSKTVKHYSKNY